MHAELSTHVGARGYLPRSLTTLTLYSAILRISSSRSA